MIKPTISTMFGSFENLRFWTKINVFCNFIPKESWWLGEQSIVKEKYTSLTKVEADLIRKPNSGCLWLWGDNLSEKEAEMDAYERRAPEDESIHAEYHFIVVLIFAKFRLGIRLLISQQ